MSKILLLLSAVVLCSCASGFTRAEALTREQAISVLIAQVINPSPNKDTLVASGPQNRLPPGTVVEPHRPEATPYPASARTIQAPTWFFYIDDKPEYGFVHPTRFVYIDANNPNPVIGNGIIVDAQGWWPKINGVEVEYNGPYTPLDIVYGAYPYPPEP